MDYEKKYKEALEKAQIYRNHLIETGDDTNEIEYIFPELINEDERIRKEILNVVKRFDKDTRICGKNYDYDKWIAWIEKQDNKKPIDINAIKEKAHQIAWETSKHYDPLCCKEVWCEMAAIDMASWLKKQYEQKPFNYENANIQQKDSAPKTEPKFNVGDWITDGEYTWKVIEVKPLDYILQSQDGNVVDDTISYVDEHFHLWTIEDAKNGDVLSNDTIVLIVDHLGIFENRTIIYSWYFADSNKFYGKGPNKPDRWEVEGFTPATKELRDKLFQKMSDVGYTWNEETKQLIKKQS